MCPLSHARSAHHLQSKHHARNAHHVPCKRNTSLKKAIRFCEWLFSWQGQKDLNPRPMVLETSTLPTELYPYPNISIILQKHHFVKVFCKNNLDLFCFLKCNSLITAFQVYFSAFYKSASLQNLLHWQIISMRIYF